MWSIFCYHYPSRILKNEIKNHNWIYVSIFNNVIDKNDNLLLKKVDHETTLNRLA